MHKAFLKAICFLMELKRNIVSFSYLVTEWIIFLHCILCRKKDGQRNRHIICNKWELKVISETGQLRGLVIKSRAFSLPGVQTLGNEHVINTSLVRSAVSMRLCREWQEGVHAWALVTGRMHSPCLSQRGKDLCYLGQLQPRCHGTLCQGRLSPCALPWAAALCGGCPERTSRP